MIYYATGFECVMFAEDGTVQVSIKNAGYEDMITDDLPSETAAVAEARAWMARNPATRYQHDDGTWSTAYELVEVYGIDDADEDAEAVKVWEGSTLPEGEAERMSKALNEMDAYLYDEGEL